MPSMLRPEPPRTARKGLLRRAEQGFYLIAFVTLGCFTLTVVEAGAYQAWQGWRLRSVLAAGAKGARSEAAETGLIGRIEVGRVGLSAIVAEGCRSGTLRRAVGHVPGTPFPGESGNVALAGHRDTFFRPLKDVREGDSILITTPDGRFEYTVESTAVVEPGRSELLGSTGSPELTLVTCYPFNYIGRAPKRFVVRAGLVTSRRLWPAWRPPPRG